MGMIDADTHLREGYFMDEVYNLSGEFAKFTPKRTRDGAYHEVAFAHDLDPWGPEVEKFGSHRQLYSPDRHDGRIAAMQPGGYDKEQRIRDLAASGIDKQVLFCTDSGIPLLNEGPLGLALCQSFNNALRVSHEVFAQANGLLVESLAEAVVQAALGGGGDGGGTVACVELYAGGGLFTLGLSRRFDQVWAVESHPGAVRDLRVNLARADRQNVRILEGRVERVLASLEIAPDVLVLDPPRTGVSEDALAAISALRVGRIVYVSCDPATLARDLGRLRDEGYRLASVQAFDLFPQTPHVEVLATLERC